MRKNRRLKMFVIWRRRRSVPRLRLDRETRLDSLEILTAIAAGRFERCARSGNAPVLVIKRSYVTRENKHWQEKNGGVHRLRDPLLKTSRYTAHTSSQKGGEAGEGWGWRRKDQGESRAKAITHREPTQIVSDQTPEISRAISTQSVR